jgi:type IV pilus assembly protein PilQ
MIKKIFYSSVFAVLCSMPASAVLASSLTTGTSFILPQYSKQISLDFKEADIKDVLKIFSQQIGSNFIVSDKVKDKKITVFLDKVPVEEALAKILSANGLVYRFDQGSNIFMVDLKDETEKMITRVYPLKYASVPSAKILSTFTIASDDEAGSSSGGSSSSSSSSSSSGSGATGGILDAMEPVLGKDGKIAVDERTNSLIITDAESNFLAIEQTIAKLDVPVPQVLIQVEMIDTSKSVLDEMGVKFGNTLYSASGLGGRNYFFPLNDGKMLAKQGTDAAYTSGTFSGEDFSAILQFLTTKTDTKSLARPRILTMDNQTAQIKISSNEVVGVTRTSAGSDATAAVTETAERMETGVILTVTPQVNLLTGDIMMAVSPKVIEVKQSVLGDFMDPETRGAKVMMRVHDGETIVLGGLLRSSKETTVTKIPILGDLPFVGRAFRHKMQNQRSRELLIFITPHIISGDGGSLTAKGSLVDMSARESSDSGRVQEIRSELDRASAQKNLR